MNKLDPDMGPFPLTHRAPDVIDYAGSLSMNTLRRANMMRLPLFKNGKGEPAHDTLDGSDWKLTEWVNATSGELGELAEVVLLSMMTKALGGVGNMAKKVERGDHTLVELRQKMADEMADVLTYLDILASRAGIDLGVATMDKWNRVSERVGVPLRIWSGNEWGVLNGYCTNCAGKHLRRDCPAFAWPGEAL